jgi:hypothetical protein
MVGLEVDGVLAATLGNVEDQVKVVLVRIVYERVIAQVSCEPLYIKGVGAGLLAKTVEAIYRRGFFGHFIKLTGFLVSCAIINP